MTDTIAPRSRAFRLGLWLGLLAGGIAALLLGGDDEAPPIAAAVTPAPQQGDTAHKDDTLSGSPL